MICHLRRPFYHWMLTQIHCCRPWSVWIWTLTMKAWISWRWEDGRKNEWWNTLWWTNSLPWKITIFNGTSIISMAIFHSFLYVHQRVTKVETQVFFSESRKISGWRRQWSWIKKRWSNRQILLWPTKFKSHIIITEWCDSHQDTEWATYPTVMQEKLDG